MQEEPQESADELDDAVDVTVDAMAEDAPESAAEETAEGAADDAPESAAEETAEDAGDDAPESAAEDTTEDAAANAPEMPSGAVPGDEGPAPDAEAEAPGPAARVIDPADAVLVEAVSGGLTWVPFAVYLGLWIVLAGLSAYLLYGATPDRPARWMSEYVPLLWSGVALTVLGPLLSVTVWLVARGRRPKAERRGLFASAMTRGALAAFFGVAIWVATLFVLELVASGGAL